MIAFVLLFDCDSKTARQQPRRRRPPWSTPQPTAQMQANKEEILDTISERLSERIVTLWVVAGLLKHLSAHYPS